MSKAKLKAGDRVRVTHTDYPDRIPVGVIATVDTPDGDDAHLIYHGHSLYFFSSEFDVLPHFKVGDRVRLTKDNDGFGIACDTGSVVVENGGADDCRVKFDRIIQGEYEWWVPWNSMEHIYTSCAAAEVDNLADEYGRGKRFKVGDRVRYTGKRRLGFDADMIGQVGTVTKDEGVCIGVDWDGSPVWSYGVYPDNLEHAAPATLRIEAGKFYKTRDGRKVGPYAHAFSDIWRVGEDHSTAVFEDGTTNRDGRKTDSDLIAEWTDEPIARAFPVNSRVVRANGYKPDVYGTVTGHISDEYNTVKWDDNGGNSNTWQDNELKLVKPTTIADIVARHSQSGTAIVAVLENGQPRPATRPFVHTTASAAETEASRLARTNPGKEFGVYTLGTVAKVEKTYDHEWQRLAAGGNKIGAIKELRGMTGLFLATAKDAVEDWLRREDLMRAA